MDKDDGAEELDLANVGGIFLVVFVGCVFASCYGCCEWVFLVFHKAHHYKVSVVCYLILTSNPNSLFLHILRNPSKKNLLPNSNLLLNVMVIRKRYDIVNPPRIIHPIHIHRVIHWMRLNLMLQFLETIPFAMAGAKI